MTDLKLTGDEAMSFVTAIHKQRKPLEMVENQICFTGQDSELSIYDTYANAHRVPLAADQLLFCGMVTGRKVMHSRNLNNPQTFLPHESFIMAPGEKVEIDFPEATQSSPTTCLTVEISKDKVCKVVERMSDTGSLNQLPAAGVSTVLHTQHGVETQRLLDRLVRVFVENDPDRDMLIDLGLTELIVRMLRHQDREFVLAHCSREPDRNGLYAALTYLRNNLSQPLCIEQLAKQACMSRSRLYQEFKKHFDCTPAELYQQMRLKQAAIKIEQGHTISHTCYELGYTDLSHFSRRFRQMFGCSPTAYRERFQKGVIQQ
jgi:AraC-like DNA-binding protein